MRFVATVLLLCLLAFSAFGQSDRGTITGTIADPAGAVVPNAPVEAKNVDTGAVYQAGASATGNFTLAQLPTGTYQLSVTVPGFKKYVRQNIVLQVTQTVRIDVTLEVGATSDSVTVSDVSPLLKTESGELSHNVTTNTLNSLPVLSIGAGAGTAGIRNPYAVVQLLPGSSNFTADSNLRLNGTPSNTQSLRIDGQDATYSYSAGQSVAAPSVDAIQEFAIQTSNYAAEFGQAGGGLFNVTMRSGNNQLHGSAYLYAVNEALNAGTPNTDDGNGHHLRNRQRRYDYGFNLGGPIEIPKVYDGHDKAFFFFNFEQFRQTTITSTTALTVPTAAYFTGDFTQALTGRKLGTDQINRAIMENTVYDPGSDFTSGTLRFRNPFVNNTIPFAQQDPVALKIQALIPKADTADLISNYHPVYTNTRLTYVPSIKIDYSLSSKMKLSGFWSRNDTSTPNNNGLPDPIGGTPQTNTAHTVRLNFDTTITPTLLLHMGVGLLYPIQIQTPPPFDPVQELGLKGTFTNLFPRIAGISSTSKGGGPSMGPGNAVTLHYTKPTANVSLTWVHNNHTYKFGGEAIFNGYVAYNQTYADGWLTFSPNETGLPALNGVSLPGGTVGFGYASFLMGRVDNGYTAIPTKTRLGSHGISGFVQDTWKVTRKLTLDYGLRYDFQTYLKEQYGRYGIFGPNTPNPSVGGLPGDLIFEGYGDGRCDCNFAKNYPWAFGPRIGIAYQMLPKTVLRVGAGVSYFKPDDNNSLSLSTGSQKIYSTASYGDPAYLLQDGLPYTISWPNFSGGQIPLPGTTASPSQLFDQNAGRPARQIQWSVGIQRELSSNIVLDVTYLGNVGVWWNAPFLINPNILTADRLSAFGLDINNADDRALLSVPITNSKAIARGFGNLPYPGFPTSSTVSQAIRPYPQFGSLANWHYSPLGHTWYNALQAKVTKRYSHGLDLTGSFSWQKQQALGAEEDFSFFQAVSVQVNDIMNRQQNKYLSGFDQPFLVVIAGNYTTPKLSSTNKALQAVSWAARDWVLGTVLRYGSGLPIRVPAANNALSSVLFRGTFANRVPGQPLFTQDLNCHCFDPTKTLTLNPNAWEDPPAGQFGSSAAYYSDYRQPRRPAENLSIGRVFRIREQMNLQIRAEFTNILNRYSLPSPSATNAALTTTYYKTTGLLSAGFGFSNTTNGAGSDPRAGTIVARFTF
jgi:Carboxypeptidase regulatory-like domain